MNYVLLTKTTIAHTIITAYRVIIALLSMSHWQIAYKKLSETGDLFDLKVVEST